MSLYETQSPLTQSIGLPRSREGDPVFSEPWQAQAFAMTVHLHQKGVFSWQEWADSLSREVHRPGRAADGSDYFEAWVAALCHLLSEKNVASSATLLALQHSWQRAAEATPHGKPIELTNDPMRGAAAAS
ncbi:nitrile hydratase accessory protein [Rhizobium rhizoryzae]|uniref:Nitrile hydratase accessory protein n=1 Tax=Rhizobium rhizoryzae TaxID=451876 RepID=A0A7W6LF76_9HYPH|nr:nitrile hydratase accessory protein [Rhizobium rhizoryzae]MBB4141836.1 nitrile hydratase accessory protein [Rhizobium rhizoryzae]